VSYRKEYLSEESRRNGKKGTERGHLPNCDYREGGGKEHAKWGGEEYGEI